MHRLHLRGWNERSGLWYLLLQDGTSHVYQRQSCRCCCNQGHRDLIFFDAHGHVQYRTNRTGWTRHLAYKSVSLQYYFVQYVFYDGLVDLLELHICFVCQHFVILLYDGFYTKFELSQQRRDSATGIAKRSLRRHRWLHLQRLDVRHVL